MELDPDSEGERTLPSQLIVSAPPSASAPFERTAEIPPPSGQTIFEAASSMVDVVRPPLSTMPEPLPDAADTRDLGPADAEAFTLMSAVPAPPPARTEPPPGPEALRRTARMFQHPPNGPSPGPIPEKPGASLGPVPFSRSDQDEDTGATRVGIVTPRRVEVPMPPPPTSPPPHGPLLQPPPGHMLPTPPAGPQYQQQPQGWLPHQEPPRASAPAAGKSQGVNLAQIAVAALVVIVLSFGGCFLFQSR